MNGLVTLCLTIHWFSPSPKKVQIRAGLRDRLVLLPTSVRAVHAEADAQALDYLEWFDQHMS
jgi:hypothetical protein